MGNNYVFIQLFDEIFCDKLLFLFYYWSKSIEKKKNIW